MIKEGKIPIALSVAFGIVILILLLISMTAYPVNVQVYRSLDKVALEESDLPSNNYYFTATRKSPSDISAESIALGWKEGYQIAFYNRGQLVLQQDISIYPKENIEKVIDKPLELTDWQIEERPSPNIGQKSRMYLLTPSNGDAVESIYTIEFIKGDTYSILFSPDESLLFDLAKTAENKIPFFYVQPAMMLALALAAMYLLGLITYSVHTNVLRKSQTKKIIPKEEKPT